MPSKAHFRVWGKFNGAHEATVTVDRQADLITVRPLRRRKAYELRLADVAEWIMWRVIKAELTEKKKQKMMKRKGILG